MTSLTNNFILGLLLLMQGSISAQTHFNSWFRATVGLPINHQWRIDAEFQHRRQNGFENWSPVDKNLMLTFRTWVYYEPTDWIKISVTPFAYFNHHRVINTLGDETSNSVEEIRFNVGFEPKVFLGQNLSIAFRSAVDYRLFLGFEDVVRFRERALFQWHITRKWSLNVYDELLLNFVGAPSGHLYDHNRLGAEVDWRIKPRFKMTFGYMFVQRLPQSNSHLQFDHNLIVNFSYLFKELKK